MRALSLVAVALVAAVWPTTANARPKKKAAAAGANAPGGAACGVKLLPLTAGAQWTYNPIAAPLPPADAIKRIAPNQPKQIVITVKSVEAKGTDTLVTLEEKFQYEHAKPGDPKPVIEERAITSTITCNDKKFDISPESFFFAGEPGGYVGLELTKVEHKNGTSIQLTKGAIGEAPWGEDLLLEWTQKPTEGSNAKLASGKLEMERRFTPAEPEPITTKMGMYRPEKLVLVTTGRVTLNEAQPTNKPMELPAGWSSTLWLADGIGMVQALNSFGHMYQLVDTGNAKDRPADGSSAPMDGAAPADAKPADAAPAAPAKTTKKKKKGK